MVAVLRLRNAASAGMVPDLRAVSRRVLDAATHYDNCYESAKHHRWLIENPPPKGPTP